MKKTLSIKDVEVENIDYVNSLKGEGETAADALTNLILLAKNADKKEDVIKALKEGIEHSNTANKSLTLEIEELRSNLHLEIEALKTQLETQQAEQTELLKLLAETQNKSFIDFEPNVKDALVNLRRFLKSKNKIPTESTEKEFLNRFVNGALLDFIGDKYDFIKL